MTHLKSSDNKYKDPLDYYTLAINTFKFYFSYRVYDDVRAYMTLPRLKLCTIACRALDKPFNRTLTFIGSSIHF